MRVAHGRGHGGVDRDQRDPPSTRQLGRRDGIPLKVVSERLGHSTPAFTMAVYQHVLPGMQRDAANTFARLITPVDPDDTIT